MLTPTKKTIVLGDGREITLETGKLAKQADGAVELRFNNTMLLATVVSAKDAEAGADFMPLTVEYKERYSSFGRFPGGFTKREGRASDYEILTARLVDRVLRPLFPSNYHANTIVHILMFSSDGADCPDALAGLAASAAIAVSDVPFEEPISEVRVARIDGNFVINPTFEQLENADMELMVGATYDNIMMVEGEMDEVQEEDLIAALKFAHDAIKPMCELQTALSKELGKDFKFVFVGDGSDFIRIRDLAEDLDVEKNVVFLGERSDVPILLNGFDVFVFPSKFEGLGMTVVEAQANGLPCVISDVIPDEVIVSDIVTKLSLEDTIDNWVKELESSNIREIERKRYAEIVAESGYGIERISASLKQLYREFTI